MDQIEKLFNEFFGVNIQKQNYKSNATCDNEIAYVKNETNSELILPLPGFTKDVMSITCQNNILTISCDTPAKDNKYQYTFTKKIKVSEKYDTDKISADMSDGILKITIPLLEKEITKPKTIKIK